MGVMLLMCQNTTMRVYGARIKIRKSKDYVYGIWVYKALDIWKGYYRVKKITGFVHETVNRGKK